MKRINSISIDITYKCNLRCKHCYNHSGDHNFGISEMTDEQYMNLVKDISKLYVESICICGGETLLRFDLACKMAKYLKENSLNKNVCVNMVTNGLLLNEDKAKKIKNSGFYLIQISVDGLRESHEWLRGVKGSYDKAISAIKLLRKYGIKVAVSCAPSKHNKDEFNQLCRILDELGVSDFRVQPMMILGRAHNIRNELLNYNEYMVLGRKLKEIKVLENLNMNVEWGDPLQHIIGTRTEQCELDFITLSAYGDLLISPYLPISFGNLKRHTLIDYINAGFFTKWNTEFVTKIMDLVNTPETLDVSTVNKKMPAIFSGNNINLDIIENDIENLSKELLNEYF